MADSGVLYLFPLDGNLQISPARLEVLKSVDCSPANTRRSGQLLATSAFSAKVSYFEHNEINTSPGIISVLKEGKSVAVISDGTVGLVDPVSRVRGRGGIDPVEALPAPLRYPPDGFRTSTRPVFFEGFLPVNRKTCHDRGSAGFAAYYSDYEW